MKIQKFVPILLASALLASCKTPTPAVSSSAPSNEQPASSVLPSEESTTPASSEEKPASSEETPVSSETSSSAVTTPSSSSEEPVTPPASSSEEPTPAVISSWEQITESARTQVNLFFTKFHRDGKESTHKPDDFLPVLPVAPSVAWTYDESYGAKYGNSFGVAALTGDDANENKALIAQYNKLLLAKGWAKATDSDFDDFDVIGLALYGTNVYCMDDTDSDKRLVAEIIPCADAEGDGLMTYAPTDPEGNEITSGIFIVVQTA